MQPDQKATLKTIAHIVGCSDTTVSRVLNGKASAYRISKETERVVLETAQSLNFTPNQVARSLRLQKTNTIGLVIPDISNAFFSSITKSVEQVAKAHGFFVLVSNSNGDQDMEQKLLELLNMRNVDGFIVSPVGLQSDHLEQLANSGKPVVMVDRYFSNIDIPFVVSDNYTGAFEAVEHLIQNGHQRIACIQGLKNTTPNEDRVRGYVDALNKYNISIDETLITGGQGFTEQTGYLEAKLLLRKSDRPTAIFSFCNTISFGIIRASIEENIEIPKDLSVISFDDQPYTDYLKVALSTVSQQNGEMGRLAARMLIDRIESNLSEKTDGIFLPTKLVTRNSVSKIN